MKYDRCRDRMDRITGYAGAPQRRQPGKLLRLLLTGLLAVLLSAWYCQAQPADDAAGVRTCAGQAALLANQNTRSTKAGDSITFGHYEQDNDLRNGKEPIEWLVLEVRNGRALVLSRYGLDAKAYSSDRAADTWEVCALRKWLNEEFLNAAFSGKEKSAILRTEVDNSESQGYSGWNAPQSCGTTRDWIFLLSYAEANRYLGITYGSMSYDLNSLVSPTVYARVRGAYSTGMYTTAEGADCGWWWLRSPNSARGEAACVLRDGSLGYNSVPSEAGCVRPALWIDLEAV